MRNLLATITSRDVGNDIDYETLSESSYHTPS